MGRPALDNPFRARNQGTLPAGLPSQNHRKSLHPLTSPRPEPLNPLIALTLVSGTSLLGSVTFALGRRLKAVVPFLVSAAAGVLLATALTHMLPEAFEQSGSSQTVGLLLAAGFLFSFLLERCLGILFQAKSLTANVLLSGAVHSFIDGIGIAAAFASSHAAGVAITLAVLLHEVPHHIADIGVLIYSGLTRRQAILLNLLATTSCVIGGALVLLYGSSVTRVTPILLPRTAANFLYLSVGILMPEMQKERNKLRSLAQMAVLIASACLAAYVSRIFPE